MRHRVSPQKQRHHAETMKNCRGKKKSFLCYRQDLFEFDDKCPAFFANLIPKSGLQDINRLSGNLK